MKKRHILNDLLFIFFITLESHSIFNHILLFIINIL